MQTAKKYFEKTPVSASPAETPVRIAGEDTSPVLSPAAELQGHLQEAFSPELNEERWSYRRTAAFLFVTCGGFWACVAWAVSLLLR